MSGKVVSMAVSGVIQKAYADVVYNPKTRKYEQVTPTTPFKIMLTPEKGNTYIMIFSRGQSDLLTEFKKHFGKYIVFEGKPSKNDAHGNKTDDGAANTIVIWDYK